MVLEALRIIKEDNFEFRILDQNVLHILYSDNIVVGLADVIAIRNTYEALDDPKPMNVITEMGLLSSITSEARDYAAEHCRLPNFVRTIS